MFYEDDTEKKKNPFLISREFNLEFQTNLLYDALFNKC